MESGFTDISAVVSSTLTAYELRSVAHTVASDTFPFLTSKTARDRNLAFWLLELAPLGYVTLFGILGYALIVSFLINDPVKISDTEIEQQDQLEQELHLLVYVILLDSVVHEKVHSVVFHAPSRSQ